MACSVKKSDTLEEQRLNVDKRAEEFCKKHYSKIGELDAVYPLMIPTYFIPHVKEIIPDCPNDALPGGSKLKPDLKYIETQVKQIVMAGMKSPPTKVALDIDLLKEIELRIAQMIQAMDSALSDFSSTSIEETRKDAQQRYVKAIGELIIKNWTHLIYDMRKKSNFELVVYQKLEACNEAIAYECDKIINEALTKKLKDMKDFKIFKVFRKLY